MIYQLTINTAAAMKAAGIPGQVFFGVERFDRDQASVPRVQVLYDDRADSYEAPGTTRSETVIGNAAFSKWTGIVVNVSGTSTKSAAGEHDHKRAVQALADLFLIYLQKIAHGQRNALRNITGGFLPPADEKQRETGAHYEIRMQIGGAVLEAPAALAASSLVGLTMTVAAVDGVTNLENVTPKIAMVGAPSVSVTGATKTYTRSAGSFVADGFAAGMVIHVAGCPTAGNNGTKTIATVGALAVTVNETCTDDGLTAGVVIAT